MAFLLSFRTRLQNANCSDAKEFANRAIEEEPAGRFQESLFADAFSTREKANHFRDHVVKVLEQNEFESGRVFPPLRVCANDTVLFDTKMGIVLICHTLGPVFPVATRELTKTMRKVLRKLYCAKSSVPINRRNAGTLLNSKAKSVTAVPTLAVGGHALVG